MNRRNLLKGLLAAATVPLFGVAGKILPALPEAYAGWIYKGPNPVPFDPLGEIASAAYKFYAADRKGEVHKYGQFFLLRGDHSSEELDRVRGELRRKAALSARRLQLKGHRVLALSEAPFGDVEAL